MVTQQATNDQMEKLSNNSKQSDIESKSKKSTEAETERCEYGAVKVNVIASNVSDKQGRERICDESQPSKETVKANEIEEESIDEPLSMEIDYKTQFEDDAQSLEIEKEINSKSVFYFKNGHKCWELRHLKNIKEAHEELNGDRSAIVDNTLTSADIICTSRDLRKYISFLDGNADYENQGGMGFKLSIVDIEMALIEAAADNHGWHCHNLAKLDKLVFEAQKYKLKLETIQVVDPGSLIETYDDGYGGYGDY